jgi:hypothetical protein
MTLYIVYVATNPAMPGLVKIGRTLHEEAQARLGQLYSSGVPFPFKLEFACRVSNPDEVERALHTAFAPQRVNPRREFFAIEAGQAIAILKLLHTDDATAEVERQASAVPADEVAAAQAYGSRRPNMNFIEMGIPIGSELTSTVSDSVVVVRAPKKVCFRDQSEPISLTAATRQVLGIEYSVQPSPYWTFEGRSLQEIYEQTYPFEEA